jgi:hypothetical protein
MEVENSRQAGISLSKLRTGKLFIQLPELVRHIPQMTEAQILQTLFRAEQLADFAFLVRGACASELRQRSIKLPGGRGKKDTVGRGLQSQMEDLARKVGTGRKTLETDARLKDTFFPVIDETTLEQMPPLAREYYVIALSAPDPHAAIKTAVDRCSDPHFSLRQFRAEVRLLKTAVSADTTILASAEHLLALNARVTSEIMSLVTDLITKTGKINDEVVAEAIRTLHASVSKSSERMTGISKLPRSGTHTHDDKQLELKM